MSELHRPEQPGHTQTKCSLTSAGGLQHGGLHFPHAQNHAYTAMRQSVILLPYTLSADHIALFNAESKRTHSEGPSQWPLTAMGEVRPSMWPCVGHAQ